MTILAASSRRRAADDIELPEATEEPPYAPVTYCTLPPYPPNGSLNVIHPSVHDFGHKWNGYRWWMANTPYPPDADENPCIYASNDMVNWVAPDGLSNPIDPWPGQATNNTSWYNSDTELFADDNGDLICFYREFTGSREIVRGRVSANGRVWSDEYTLIDTPGTSSRLSPSVVRIGPGDFRLWFVSGELWTASEPLGHWQLNGTASFGSPSHHGSVERYADGVLIAAVTTGTGGVRLGHSVNGGASWVMSPEAVIAAGVVNAYRPTMTRSPKPGWIDVWIGGSLTEGTGTRTAYTRVPLSAFGI